MEHSHLWRDRIEHAQAQGVCNFKFCQCDSESLEILA